jgi:hypothetical protein
MDTMVTQIAIPILEALKIDKNKFIHTVLSYDKIGIESLNVKSMSSNLMLARHVLDQSFYEF